MSAPALTVKPAEAPIPAPVAITRPRRSIGLWTCVGLGAALLALNLYGELYSLRRPELAADTHLRFGDDLKLSYAETSQQLRRLKNEADSDYMLRANHVIQDGIAHVDWERSDTEHYHLRVPIWENYILFALSYIRPGDYRRYHFRDAGRTLERGVGVCGDAANVLSQVLEREGIETRIVALPGHVILEADPSDQPGQTWMLDPDFGVATPHTVVELKDRPQLLTEAYRQAGYPQRDLDTLTRLFSKQADVYDNAFAFSPNLTRAESAAYFLKWAIPAGLLLLPGLIWRRRG
jgi:hypothetical protein